MRAAWAKKRLGPSSEAELERWVSAVSSHSIRVGVAQDNFAAGEALPAIMQAYRWRDPTTVMRYGARLATRRGASARLAARFSKEHACPSAALRRRRIAVAEIGRAACRERVFQSGWSSVVAV